MAAANFSRNAFSTIIEANEDDLIDFESVLENPPFALAWNKDFGVYQPLGKQKLYNHCNWLKIGKKERCGKRCEQFFCSIHSKIINKGGIIPLPCLFCGVGMRRPNQFCTKYCELIYCATINEIKQARRQYKWDEDNQGL